MVGGVLLAVSRAIGETMIVVMAAGLSANLPPTLRQLTTVTVQIVQLLTGDQEFDSAKTLAAFALGLVLFLITLALNLIALSFVRRYRKLMNSVAADFPATRWTDQAMQSRLRKRYRSERLFKFLGFAAVGISLAFLAFLLGTMIWKGIGGLTLDFLRNSDLTDAATAGVWGALKGSFLTIIVTMALAFPVGVLSAIYLEEYAPRNRWTDLIEVSINNLAAVPSIIFGLLGLAVFLNTMNLPRSAPLVGGLTLALMTMPVIVIAGRNAITSVPPSIREAALGVGASKMQVVFHHVLPLALPGILTGTIIGMARLSARRLRC